MLRQPFMIAILLTMAGAVPVLVLGAIVLLEPLASQTAIEVLVSYGAVALSFTGAVHWGFALRDTAHPAVLPASGGAAATSKPSPSMCWRRNQRSARRAWATASRSAPVKRASGGDVGQSSQKCEKTIRFSALQPPAHRFHKGEYLPSASVMAASLSARPNAQSCYRYDKRDARRRYWSWFSSSLCVKLG